MSASAPASASRDDEESVAWGYRFREVILDYLQKLPENEKLLFMPSGYRFHPRDEELVMDYLQKQIDGQPLSIQIPQICLAATNPQAISEKYSKIGDEYWYFFTSRDRKYPNGKRPNRGAESGYWKATGSDKSVMLGTKVIGYKKTLVFYQGKPLSGEKTDWIMQEYRANQLPRQKQSPTDMRLDDCVLCRIHYKAAKQNPRTEEDDGHDIHEEENHSNPSPTQVIMGGGGDRDMKIDNNYSHYYDQDLNIGDEGFLQNFLGVLEQGEPPSMEDILQPQPQPQAFGVQGFDAAAAAAASTSASSSQNNINSHIYTNFLTSASTTASSSQNNINSRIYTNFSTSASTTASTSASTSQNNK